MTSAEKGDLRSLLNIMKAVSYESKEEKVQSVDRKLSDHAKESQDDFKWLEDKNHLKYQNELHKEEFSDFDEENLEVLVSIMGAIKADIEQMIQFL